MNRFFADEIRTKSAQIRARGISEEGIDRILQAYRNIMKAAWIGRNDGLLDLEEFAINFDDGSAAGRLFARLIVCVCNGFDPGLVEEIGAFKAAALDLPDYDGLILVMCIRGVLYIQAGHHPYAVHELLISMWPEELYEPIRKQEGWGVGENEDPTDVFWNGRF